MSIRSLGKGKYIVDYYVTDTITGERHHTSKRVNGLREAKNFEATCSKQRAITKCNSTVQDMFNGYMKTLEGNEETKRQYNTRFEKYVTFKDRNIETIKKSELIEWYNQIKELDLANLTKNKIFNFVKASYRYANEIYDIKDISSCLKTLKLHRVEKDILTPEEFNKVVSYETNPIYYAFFFTLYWTGCRRGELRPLYKTDLVNDCLYIKRTMRLNEDSIVDRLKTGETLKVVKLDKDTLKVLKPLAKRKGLYMFGDDIPLSNESIRRHLNDCMKQSGIKKNITIHCLRHSHGSVLLEAGLDLASVSKRLGHKSIYTTANIYSHVLDQSGQKSVDIIDKIKKK